MCRLYHLLIPISFICENYDEPGACGVFCGDDDVWTDDDSEPL